MNILFLDEEFPYPLNSGKRLRSFNLTKNLAKTNNVSYLAYGNDNSDSFNCLSRHNIKPIAVAPPQRNKSGLKFYFRLLMNLFSRYPYIVTSHFTYRFQDKLSQQVKEEKYDIIICEWTPYAIFVKNINNKKIIVAHNIESSIWKRYEINEPNSLKKLYISLQRKKVEKFEMECFNWVDGATAVSQQEAEVIASYNQNIIPVVVDNGVDTEYFKPSTADIDINHIVFTGAMDWRPNQDAVIYFVNDIFPILKKLKPKIKVTFVGRNPSKTIRNLGNNKDITITGTVDDVRPYIEKAVVYIVPLRIGGGSRLKILEAMAMKKAVVSTSIGAEGLSITNNENIILEDNHNNFANAIAKLIDDAELRKSISENGLILVNEKYRWEIIAKKFDNYLRIVAGNK